MTFRDLLKKFRAIITTKHVGGFNNTLFVQSTTNNSNLQHCSRETEKSASYRELEAYN